MTEELYRGGVRGLPVYWTAFCRTYYGSNLVLYARTPGELVRNLQSDAWCECIKYVLAMQEVRQGEEVNRAVA